MSDLDEESDFDYPFFDCFLIQNEAMEVLFHYVANLSEENAMRMIEALTPDPNDAKHDEVN
jgi:hypothetical protein